MGSTLEDSFFVQVLEFFWRAIMVSFSGRMTSQKRRKCSSKQKTVVGLSPEKGFGYRV